MNRLVVTLGYAAAGAIAAALWLGIGITLIPVMLLMALAHALAASDDGLVRAHHRWLARHHLYSALVLIAVIVLPVLTLPTLLDHTMTVINTLRYAPHPLETLAAAWPQLGVGTLLLAVFIALAGWLIAMIWISLRLVRAWLRWMDGRPA